MLSVVRHLTKAEYSFHPSRVSNGATTDTASIQMLHEQSSVVQDMCYNSRLELHRTLNTPRLATNLGGDISCAIFIMKMQECCHMGPDEAGCTQYC